MCMICGFPLCSPITSFEFEDQKCHIYICHYMLGSTTKPKWAIARIQSQLHVHTQWRTFIFCGCKKQYNMDIDRYEALHCLQNLSKGKDCSRIWGRKYSSHGHYSRKWYVIYGLVCYNFRERTKLELCRLNFYKSHIPCSSISSSEFEGSKCHLYICHRHLESTTKPKWDIARL